MSSDQKPTPAPLFLQDPKAVVATRTGVKAGLKRTEKTRKQ